MTNVLTNAPQDINAYRDGFSSAICSMDCDVEQGDTEFSTRFSGAQLGEVDIFKYHGETLRTLTRSAQHVESNPVDDFLVLLPLNAPFGISQLQHETLLEPGKFVLLSTMKPFASFSVGPAHHLLSEFIIKIPGSLFRQQIPHVDQCCGIPVTARHGAGKVAKSMIQTLFAERDELSDMQSRMFGSMLINAIGAATLNAPELKDFFGSRRQQAHGHVRAKAQAFIECNLSNPRLDAAMIASHCHVSLRHLRASFESVDTTVGTIIREMRLQRCQAELINPALRNQSIIQIAMKWGYGSSASFARAYRERFGKSPNEERHTSIFASDMH